MKARWPGCLLLISAVTLSAHRLDEYLQATRVAVATNRIDVSVDLTPGVAVVAKVLTAIDTNRDGQLSDRECESYAQRMLKDLRVGMDGKLLPLTLSESSFPTVQEMTQGLGTIRVRASTRVDPLRPGSHTLTLTNSHLRKISVYLVNALVPEDPSIQINQQKRDKRQRGYRLTFTVNAASR